MLAGPRPVRARQPARQLARLDQTVPPGPVIRIGSNENPHGAWPASLAAIHSSGGIANRYPGASVSDLRKALAGVHGVAPEWILLGAGSGELLRASVQAFVSSSTALVSPVPTFEGPARAAEAAGFPVRAVPVDSAQRADLAATADQASGAGLLFICNPNNPTGTVHGGDSIVEFLARVRAQSADAVVLLDEAYYEYAEEPSYRTGVPLTTTDKRVVVVRTFSKVFGLAGLRVGYAIGHPDLLAAIGRHASSGTLSALSAAAASAALADTVELRRQRELNRAARAYTTGAFTDAGYKVVPSDANFVMVDIRREVRDFQTACREAGVMIARPFPPLTTFARISIGTMEEMRTAIPIFLRLLKQPTAPAPQAGGSPAAGRLEGVFDSDWMGC